MQNTLAVELTKLQKMIVEEEVKPLKQTSERLRQSEHAPALSYLLNAIDNDRINDAATLVKDLLRQQEQQLAVYIDPVIGALKVELTYQQNELSKKEVTSEEYSKLIDLFHARYFSKVGYLIEKLLFLRREKLRIQVRMNPDLQKLLDLAEQEYTDFFEYKEQSKDGIIYQLSDAKLKEIKRLYRRASMVCHPDRVKEEQRAQAEELFNKLQKAYKRNDIKKVRSIATFLEKADHFDMKIDAYDNVEVVRAQIENILAQIEEKEDEIATILGSSAYQTVKGIKEDWNDYFAVIQDNFKAQIGEIEEWIKGNKGMKNEELGF